MLELEELSLLLLRQQEPHLHLLLQPGLNLQRQQRAVRLEKVHLGACLGLQLRRVGGESHSRVDGRI